MSERISKRTNMGMRAGKVNLAFFVAVAMWLLASAGLAQAQTDGAKNSADDSAAHSTLPVVYLPKQALDANFAKATTVHQSPVLYDGDHGLRNYAIATSRRYKPSNVEMHMKDTDIMYVLKGSATIVTGVKLSGITPNKLPNGNPGPADEIRATEIVGGDARNLSTGDVIIIPNGVGHQFTKVDGPFMYVVVKCRAN